MRFLHKILLEEVEPIVLFVNVFACMRGKMWDQSGVCGFNLCVVLKSVHDFEACLKDLYFLSPSFRVHKIRIPLKKSFIHAHSVKRFASIDLRYIGGNAFLTN